MFSSSSGGGLTVRAKAAERASRWKIINAGMKIALFEAISLRAGHDGELRAYASRLLAVEKKDGVTSHRRLLALFIARLPQAAISAG